MLLRHVMSGTIADDDLVPADAEVGERLGGALHEIADAVHVDHGPVGPGVVKNAGELGDPGLFLWQEQIAMAIG